MLRLGPPRRQQGASALFGLDTLRAVAIVWVMLFHLQPRLPPAFGRVAEYGWMGVDLFFVLSGFLIGSQLLKPYAAGAKPALAAFYRKRAFRILPAYLCVLLLYFAWPAWREQPGLSPAWQFLTFTLNYSIDYANNSAFSHAWSLCVEEHFYLVLPLLLLAMLRKPSPARTIAMLAALVAAGIAIRGYLLLHLVRPAADNAALVYLERIYYPTHARLDGLLAGVALALIRTFRKGWWAALSRHGHTTGVAGALLLGLSLWLSHDRFELATRMAFFNVCLGPPLLALAFTLLTASAMSEHGALSRIHVPGTRTLALLAFSLYLTHKEMAHLANIYLPRLTEQRDALAAAIYAAACLLGAAVLYAGVERPFVSLRERIEGRTRSPTAETMRADPAL